jgi:hypothetical protein
MLWCPVLTFFVAESNKGGNLNRASTTDTSSGLGGLASAAGVLAGQDYYQAHTAAYRSCG